MRNLVTRLIADCEEAPAPVADRDTSLLPVTEDVPSPVLEAFLKTLRRVETLDCPNPDAVALRSAVSLPIAVFAVVA